jgi:DNA end-binding protein Ku
MPPPGTGVLSFGLVSIPVRIHTATHSENVSFHLLHKKCGSRVRNQHYCPVCHVVVERTDLVRGFQQTKDKYIPITEEELESLEAEANRNIDLKEFIPLASVDPVYFENTHYLGADKGGEKPYKLLAEALAKKRPRGDRGAGKPRQRTAGVDPAVPERLGAAHNVLR